MQLEARSHPGDIYTLHIDSAFSKLVSRCIISNIIMPLIVYLREVENYDLRFETVMIWLCSNGERIKGVKTKILDPNVRICKRPIIRGPRKGLYCGKKCVSNSDYCSKRCEKMEKIHVKIKESSFPGLFINEKKYLFAQREGEYLLVGFLNGRIIKKFDDDKYNILVEKYNFDSDDNIDTYIRLHGKSDKSYSKAPKAKPVTNDHDYVDMPTESSSDDDVTEGVYVF